MKWLGTLQHRWALGFAAALVLGLTLLSFGLLAALVLLPFSAAFGWSDREFEGWLLLSAVVWLPLGVGTVVPTIARWRNLDKPEPRALVTRA